MSDLLILESEVSDEVADRILAIAFMVWRALPREKIGEDKDVTESRRWARDTIKSYGFKVPIR